MMSVRRLWFPGCLAVVAALALVVRLIPGPRTIDDAYITFRYARNLVAGLGLVYNPGEHVLGTTTPLYTLLLAGLARGSGWTDYAQMAWLVNSLADTLGCLGLAYLAWQLTRRPGLTLAVASLWAIAPMSVTFAVGGMETSLCILLLIGSAAAYLTGRTRLTALGAALLVLTRPDTLLWVAPLLADAAWRFWRARRWPWMEAALFAGILLPWLGFATWYYGSPWPHSLAAKAVAYRMPDGAALVRLIQHYGTPFFEQHLLGRFWPLAGFIGYTTLSWIGGLTLIRKDSRAWVIAVYPWIYLITFAAANPLLFRWYLAPPLPFYFLLILTGASHLAERLSRPLPANRWTVAGHSLRLSMLLILPYLGWVMTSLSEWTLHPDHGADRPAPQMAWHALELVYTEIARELAPRLTTGQVIAAGDVGALGYYSNARILDTVGLMSPEATTYYPLDPALYEIVYAMPPQLILDYLPDYVVLVEVYGRQGLLKDPRFLALYRLEQSRPVAVFSPDDRVQVWQRR